MSSAFYFFSILALLSGLILIKKSEQQYNLIASLGAIFLFFMCYQTSIAYILSFTPVEVSICSIGVTNLILAMLCFCFVFRQKEIQKYKFFWMDLLVAVVLFGVALGCGFHQFDTGLKLFNYASTIDSSRHLAYARDVARHHEICSIPFMAVNTGLWMEACYPFMKKYTDYRFMMPTDVAMLFLSGLMFWRALRYKMKKNQDMMIGLVMTLLYVCGYPLNNMVFGTSYLGAGVSCTILIYVLMTAYEELDLNQKYYGFAQLIVLIALLKAYPLFFPIIAVSVFLYHGLHWMASKQYFSKQIHIIPIGLSVLGMLAVYFGFSIARNYVDSLIPFTWEGYMYRNLFGDIIYFAPLALYFLYLCFRRKSVTIEYVMTVLLGGYILALAGLTYSGYMSTYYFHKIYYLFWFYLLLLSYMTILSLKEEERKLLWCYVFTLVVIATYTVTGFEKKVQDGTIVRGNYFSEQSTGKSLFRLYSWNYEFGSKEKMWISANNEDLFQKVAELTEGTNDRAMYAGLYRYHQFDFYALGDQIEDDSPMRISQDMITEWIPSKYKYICLLYSEQDQMPWDISEYLDSLDVIYENAAGKILLVQ